LLERVDIDTTARRIVSLLRHPRPVPDEDFFPLRNMLAKTLEIYERLAQVPPDDAS
jgi:hypothetical protein